MVEHTTPARARTGVRGRGQAAAARELLGYLGELGLNLTEARIYLALLEAVELTASQVADRANVPRPKVYEGLRGLEERGLCVSITGKARLFRAGDIERGLEGLATQREHMRRHAAARDAEVVGLLRERLPHPPAPEAVRPFDYLEAVVGRKRTDLAMERMLSEAITRIDIMQQPPFGQVRSQWNTAEVAAIERGVAVRVIFSEQALTDSHRYAALLLAGAQIRVATEVPMKLLIGDGSQAMLALRDPDTHEQGITSIVVRHPDVVASFELMFTAQWASARPLSDEERDRSGNTA